MGSAADSLGYAGKRVVVTGCRSGIGAATARLLLDAGAKVHGIDWQESDLPLAAFTRLDLRDPQAIAAAAAEITGPVDALFNCAGLPPMQPPLDVLKVNFIGMRMLTEALLDRMPAGSAIVSVGSVGGARWPQHLPELRELIATENFAAALAWCETHDLAQADGYGFSKEAIAVWTMVASARTIAQGVRINCTSPGSVQTPMLAAIEEVTPSERIDAVAAQIGRRSTAEEQAWVLLMLNSPRSSYLNGVNLPADGGFAAANAIR